MKRIVAKAGGGTDTTRDYEYTDWDDVRVFAREFAQRVEGRHHTEADKREQSREAAHRHASQ